MTETYTRIRLKDSKQNGILERGQLTYELARDRYITYAEAEFAKAQKILAAGPEDFDVDIVKGAIKEKFVFKVEPK